MPAVNSSKNFSHYDQFAEYEINPPKKEEKSEGLPPLEISPSDDFLANEPQISSENKQRDPASKPQAKFSEAFAHKKPQRTDVVEFAFDNIVVSGEYEEPKPSKPEVEPFVAAKEIDFEDLPAKAASQEVLTEAAKAEEIKKEEPEVATEIKTKNEVPSQKAPEPLPEPLPELLPEIEPVNFVNVLSMQDFKNSDNFTFVLGRSEAGNILFENLKQSYNIAFFANEKSYELLHSMLLSFMLKNSENDFKLALCDGANNQNLDFYKFSKYLLGDIASGDELISQKLQELILELEQRYRTLARFNVRSIDEYNIVAKSKAADRLPHIMLVIDGYEQLMKSQNFEIIKSNLYQILRLGRIAGIYVVVVTNKKIEEDIINFNLPSRIGFKCSGADESISMIGETGINKLANSNEYFYAGIHSEKAKHLRQPSISSSIIKILIDNIEK